MILIFPFTMRESINYAIRARLRGEKIMGAADCEALYREYCDEFVILPSIFDDGFEKAARNLKGVTRFYTPSEIIYQHVKSLNIPWEFAEGSPVEIMNEEYRAAEQTGLLPELVLQIGRVHGHMSEEKLAAIFKLAVPRGDILEIGVAWGKSLITLALSGRKIYAIDTWDRECAIQYEAHPIINKFTLNTDWSMMKNICRVNAYPFDNIIFGEAPKSCALLHIDGNHDYVNVKNDWEKYGNLLIRNGYLVLDDISWRGVAKLWEEIKHEFSYSFVKGGAVFAKKV